MHGNVPLSLFEIPKYAKFEPFITNLKDFRRFAAIDLITFESPISKSWLRAWSIMSKFQVIFNWHNNEETSGYIMKHYFCNKENYEFIDQLQKSYAFMFSILLL